MKKFIRLLQILSVLVVVAAVVSPAIGAGLKKLDAHGKELPDDAAQWDIIHDAGSGLYWEVKKDDESIHSKKDLYKWKTSKTKFLDKLNEDKFGGFSDWRLPLTEELSTIKIKSAEAPFVDQNYFPHTTSSKYITMSWCGSESEYQPASLKFGEERSKGGKFVRAVRGKDLDE